MKRLPGVVVGLVKSLDDPAGEGRIQVEFPWLPDTHRSAWAPIAVPLAGKNRGMFFMPEIDDECLVAFEHGDFDHPYVVGFLWNGVDLPPDDDINASVRRIKTVSGHIVDFDDRDGQEKITTQGGHHIELRDDEQKISIRTTGGHHIDLSDQENSINATTAAGQELKLSDMPSQAYLKTATGSQITIDVSGITVSAPSGNLTVNCLQANVTATSMINVTASAVLNVTAPIANFSGILRANVVQASAVISTAYTPGAGNLFGL